MIMRGRSKKCRLQYVAEIKVDRRLEEVNVIVIREASSLESIPQISGSWEETVQIEILLTNGLQRE